MNRLLLALITLTLYSFEIFAAQSGVKTSDEDRSALAEAIAARNLEAPGKYASRDEVSIFEKITNAYIRNYDKVLATKKDEDLKEKRKI